ncbi:metalloprotein [Haemophilus paracuniculus]|uniref:Metalloprotein n=1 Tax=Haemophilus paracuniculus TaxID=734 RepID=A0A1T0AS48_9PAST|nr:VOC family protein [Haemophilus paracuniculus]OOR99062.1 metalloprotein [Haemophilus paracuniculus]
MIQENAKIFENLTACFGDLARFSRQIADIAKVARIDLSPLVIDHLAVRMNDLTTAEQWREMLQSQSRLLKMSEVNGRPIYLFELNAPLVFLDQSVSIIELPFPKGKIYPEQGWEHIEAVFPMLEGESVEAWIERTLTTFGLAENPELTLKISEPKVAGERLPNPSVAITLKSGTSLNNCCLKVHPYGINDVICSEIHF